MPSMMDVQRDLEAPGPGGILCVVRRNSARSKVQSDPAFLNRVVERGVVVEVGSGQVTAWLDESVDGLLPGQSACLLTARDYKPLHTVHVQQVVYRIADVSLPPLPGVSRETLARSGHKTKGGYTQELPGMPNKIDDYSKVDMLNWDERRPVSDEECHARAEAARAAGNELLNSTGVSRALVRTSAKYQEALYWNYRASDPDDSFAVRILLNMALLKGKTDDWLTSVLYCDAALALKPDSAKALFRRAQAFRKRSLFIPAQRDITRAHELAPDDPLIKQTLDAVQKEKLFLHNKMRRDFAETYNAMIQSPVYSETTL